MKGPEMSMFFDSAAQAADATSTRASVALGNKAAVLQKAPVEPASAAGTLTLAADSTRPPMACLGCSGSGKVRRAFHPTDFEACPACSGIGSVDLARVRKMLATARGVLNLWLLALPSHGGPLGRDEAQGLQVSIRAVGDVMHEAVISLGSMASRLGGPPAALLYARGLAAMVDQCLWNFVGGDSDQAPCKDDLCDTACLMLHRLEAAGQTLNLAQGEAA